MTILTNIIAPCPNSPGVEGHGEGVEYQGKYYYYPRAGKHIPKNRVSYLKWEGGWAGRQTGDKEYIVVGYNENSELVVLFSVYVEIRLKMQSIKGLSFNQVVEQIETEKKRRDAIFDTHNKCSQCGEIVMRFEEDQKDDECLSCYNKRVK